MKNTGKRLLTLLLALLLLLSVMPVSASAEGSAEEVAAMIEALSADARDYSDSDLASVEAVQAAYDALSPDDQAALDRRVTHPGSGQSLGRVLESALWTVWSFELPDNRTTLPDGTYSADTVPALGSEYSKGKSTSPRQRPWSVREVTVTEGRAYAVVTVDSETYSGILLHGRTYPRTNSSGSCEFANVPIDLNGTFYFNGISTSMPTPIAFSLTTAIQEPGEAPAPEVTELSITNNTGMFKAVTASLETLDGNTTLVMALSGSGYGKLFKGSYEEAAANGNQTENWIVGELNADGKLEFRIPVAEGESYLPLVAISNSYYEKYLSGENSLERAFYPRQAEIDFEAKTLTTGDYENTTALTVTNGTEEFPLRSAALHTVGGPNSNGYKTELLLTLGSGAFDRAFLDEAAGIGADTEGIVPGEGNVFAIPVRMLRTPGDPASVETLLNAPFVLIFRAADEEAWSKYRFTVSEAGGTLTVGAATAEAADYSAVDAALAAVPADLTPYTEESAAALNAALAAVVRELPAEQQAQVDDMARGIREAAAALVLKSDPGSEPQEGTPAEDITVTVTICAGGKLAPAADGSLVAALPVTVTDLDRSGGLSLDEAMIAAHDAFYPGGAAAGYASDGNLMSRFWGDDSWGYGYYVNNAPAWSVADELRDGDRITAWIYTDTANWSDSYAYFDKADAAAPDGSVNLTLFTASYGEDGSLVFAPYAGARITVNGDSSAYVTNGLGMVTLFFDESGSYLISALGAGEDILVPPVCRVQAAVSGKEAERIDLEITNNTAMFKAYSAYIEQSEDGCELVMALSGSGYHELFKGTYEEAVENGDNRDNWVHGYENDEGKWEFRIPLAEGESYIPCVGISQTYLDSYDAGQVPLARSFFPRQLELDWNAGTLVTGDYDNQITVAVVSGAAPFPAGTTLDMHVIGGPNSNNYSISFTLPMLDSSYDRVTYPTVTGGQVGTASAELFLGAFTIEMTNAPTKTAFQDKEPIPMKFRNAESGRITTVPVTIDLLAKTIAFGKAGNSSEDEDTEQEPLGLELTAETVNGIALATLETESILFVLEEEEPAETVFLTVISEKAHEVKLLLGAEAVAILADIRTALSVETELGTLLFPKEEVRKLAEYNNDVVVSLTAHPDESVTLNAAVLGKSAQVTFKAALPAKEGSQVLVLLRPDGTEQVMIKSLVKDGKAIALLPAGSTVRAEDRRLPFRDVGDNWFAPAVAFVSSRGLFTGVAEGEFAPGSTMTRAMMATVLYRLEGEPEASGGKSFSDVPEGKWYSEAVKWVSQQGIMNGYGESFGTGDPVTREQMAALLHSYVRSLGLPVPAGSTEGFPDAGEIHSWAAEGMAWAVGVGLFRGDDSGNLNPRSSATRAEVAELMSRLIGLLLR